MNNPNPMDSERWWLIFKDIVASLVKNQNYWFVFTMACDGKSWWLNFSVCGRVGLWQNEIMHGEAWLCFDKMWRCLKCMRRCRFMLRFTTHSFDFHMVNWFWIEPINRGIVAWASVDASQFESGDSIWVEEHLGEKKNNSKKVWFSFLCHLVFGVYL